MIEYISQLLHFISHDVETYEEGVFLILLIIVIN